MSLVEDQLWKLGLVYKPMGPTIQLEDELDSNGEEEAMVGSFKIVHTLPDKFREMIDKKKKSERDPHCAISQSFGYLFGLC